MGLIVVLVQNQYKRPSPCWGTVYTRRLTIVFIWYLSNIKANNSRNKLLARP